MSKNDIALLAQALKDSKPIESEEGNFFYATHLAQWNNMVEMITLTIAQQNPRFNRDRFLHACDYK